MVLVVGAGPAGATAARTLARAGVTVRLLDRSKFPRNKPCGGGVSLRVLKRFPYLAAELSRIATHTVSRLHLEGPGGESTVIESDGPAALMIRRVEFDALLVDLAREAGAELIGDVDIVRVSTTASGVVLESRDGRTFEAPVVIAADGVHSVIARRLGLNPGWPASRVALDMMEETPREQLRDIDPSTLWVSYGHPPSRAHGATRTNAARVSAKLADERGRAKADEGYAYVFPKRDHVNVGIGYVLDHYRNAIDESPYDLQRGFVDHLRRRGVMEGESVRRNFTPFIIPVGGPLRRPGSGRVLLAGDAGGFVNGFTAEGIYYAMVSGDLAARTIISTPAPARAKLARRYQRAVQREIGAELRDSVLIQRYLFADRRRIADVINGASQEPELTRLILDFAVGRLSYAALRWRVLGRVPRLAAHLAWGRFKTKFLPGSADVAGV
jgi:geranylgeranyl reductase family protein